MKGKIVSITFQCPVGQDPTLKGRSPSPAFIPLNAETSQFGNGFFDFAGTDETVAKMVIRKATTSRNHSFFTPPDRARSPWIGSKPPFAGCM